MELNEIRKEIDSVDKEMLSLFEKRMQLAKEVAEYKLSTGKAIYDKEREDAKIAKLTELAPGEFNKHCISELFLQIMSISRRYQYQMIGDNEGYIEKAYEQVDALPMNENTKVVYAGVPGAFAEQATIEYFGENANTQHVGSFEKVILAIEDGEAEYGVLPIENSSGGFVSGNYDLLSQYDVCIVGEEIIKVEQTLLGLPGASLDDIKVVYSHPQGLLQSRKFLETYGWKQVEYANTALSAVKVRDDGDKSQAAITSKRAAKLYGLDILKDCINDADDNSTRFMIITKKKMYAKNAKKISICFSLPHESGTLYNILGHFIFNNINLTSIESTPLKNKQWEYRFFISFEGNLNELPVINALTGIRKETIDFKILGNY